MLRFSCYFNSYVISYAGYTRNTYHGPVRHYRTPLSEAGDFKPLRFVDSPQHSVSSKNTTPKRKVSNTGLEIDVSF